MEFKTMIENVKLFNERFNIEINDKPTVGNIKNIELRHNLLKEENEEYLLAGKNNDLVEIADAITDKLYLVIGDIIYHGLENHIIDLFKEVQASNMSKLDSDGNVLYREDGKILKSELFFPPNISKILNK